MKQFRSDKTLREGCIASYETKMTKGEAKSIIDDIRAEAADLPEMTLNEINAEIRAARAERKAGNQEKHSRLLSNDQNGE